MVPLGGAEGTLCAVAVISRIGDQAHLLSLVTHPEMQGCGYGSMLLDGVVNDLRSRGCTQLFADGGPDIERWLVDRGFERVSVRELMLDL